MQTLCRGHLHKSTPGPIGNGFPLTDSSFATFARLFLWWHKVALNDLFLILHLVELYCTGMRCMSTPYSVRADK